MKIEEYKCDVCNKKDDNIVVKKYIQVIFTTDQTEGRGIAPHLSDEKLDICPECLERICNGNYLFGRGAQGCNEFWFETKRKRK